MASDI